MFAHTPPLSSLPIVLFSSKIRGEEGNQASVLSKRKTDFRCWMSMPRVSGNRGKGQRAKWREIL